MPIKIKQHYYTGVPTGFRTVAKSENLSEVTLQPYCVYNLPEDCPANAPEKPESFHYVNTGKGELIIGQSQYKPGGRAGNYFTHQYVIDPMFEEQFIGNIDISNIFGLPFSTDYQENSDNLAVLEDIPRSSNFNIHRLYEFKRDKLVMDKVEISFSMFSTLLKSMFEAAYGSNVYIHCPYKQSKNLMAILFYVLPYHMRKKIGFITYKKEVDALRNVNVVFTGKNELTREMNGNSGKLMIDVEVGRQKNIFDVKQGDVIYNYIEFAWEALKNQEGNIGKAFCALYDAVKKGLRSVSKDEYLRTLDALVKKLKNDLCVKYESMPFTPTVIQSEESKPSTETVTPVAEPKKVQTPPRVNNNIPSKQVNNGKPEDKNLDETSKSNKSSDNSTVQRGLNNNSQASTSCVDDSKVTGTHPRRVTRTNNKKKNIIIAASVVAVLSAGALITYFASSENHSKSPQVAQITTSANSSTNSDTSAKVVTLNDALAKKGLTPNDVKNNTKLDLSDTDLFDLKGIEEFSNITDLSLSSNNITDLTPLSKLTNLTKLVLSNNAIDNVTALGSLKNLQELNLFNNSIVNLEPLASLTNLTKLNVAENDIENITPLGNLTSLKRLDLYNNQIKDISALQNLVNLTALSLDGNKISKIDALKSTIKLTSLYLAGNIIESLEPIVAYYNNISKDNTDIRLTLSDTSKDTPPKIANVEVVATKRETVVKKTDKPKDTVKPKPTSAPVTVKPTEKPPSGPSAAEKAEIAKIASQTGEIQQRAGLLAGNKFKSQIKIIKDAYAKAKNAKTVNEANTALAQAQKAYDEIKAAQ